MTIIIANLFVILAAGWLFRVEVVEMYPRAGSSRQHVPDEKVARETKRNREAVLYLMDMAACPYAAIGKGDAYCGPMYDDLEVARGWKVDPDGDEREATEEAVVNAMVAARTVAVKRAHEPNAALKAVYDEGYRRYRELYERLSPMMQEQ